MNPNSQLSNITKSFLLRVILAGALVLAVGMAAAGQTWPAAAEGMAKGETRNSLAPATNDNFPGTTISTVPFSNLNLDTTNATTDTNPSGDGFVDPTSIIGWDCDSNQGEASVWYNYNPGNSTKFMYIDTIGSTYDTVVAVWKGGIGNLSLVACNDDIASEQDQLQSKLYFTAQANTNYFIEVIEFAQPAPKAQAGGILNFRMSYEVLSADSTGVFRPSNGLLYLKNRNETGFADVAINYGVGGDYPVTGDWDGDGDDTIGVYRNGIFYLRNFNTIGFANLVFAFGQPGDQPVAGDWDKNGVDTIGVYRSSTGTFYLRNSNTAGAPEMIFSLGVPGDVGIAGDWNADGRDTTGVFRPSNGALYLKNLNTTGYADIQINYGLPGDRPVTGDWDSDGDDTIGIYRNGTFYLRNSNTIGFADLVFDLGIPGDMPISGNWDGLP